MSTKKAAILTVSALLGGIATNYPQSWWWLIIFSVAGLIFLLERSSASYRKSFIMGAGYGIIYILTVLSYFWSAHPLDWAGVHNIWVSLGLVAFIWIASSVVLGVFVGLFAVTFRFFAFKQSRTVWNMFFGAFLWVVFEFLRSVAFSIFYYHDGVLVGPHWTFGFLGYTVVWSEFILPLATVGGVYLLSFAGFLSSYLLYLVAADLVSRIRVRVGILKPTSFVIFVVLVFFFISPPAYREMVSDEQLGVVLVSLYPNYDGESTASATRQLIEEGGADMEADLLILTEYVNYLDSEPFDSLEGIVGRGGVVIDSEIAYVDSNNKQAFMYFYDDQGNKIEEYRKKLLIPNGEYLPLFVRTTAKMLGEAGWVDFFDSTRGYKAGAHSTPTKVGDKDLGALFCIEILSPTLYRETVEGGARLLVNTASHSNFKGNATLINQNISMAKVRAVESGRYFVQSTNYGPAFVITQKGTVDTITAATESQIIQTKVPLLISSTTYVVLGRYIHIVFLFGLALLILLRLSKKSKE